MTSTATGKHKQVAEGGVMDLVTFSHLYWQQWPMAGALIVACLVAGGVYLWLAQPIYRAQTTLQYQALSGRGDGLSATSTLGLGFALSALQSDRSAPERSRAFGTLRSRKFLLPFIQKMQLGPYLLRSDYDNDKHSWRTPPSGEQLQNAFLDHVLSIDDNSESGLVTISIFLPDAHQAQAVANQLVTDINNTLRYDAVSQTEQNIDYLNKQLAVSQVTELRSIIAQLIQSEMRRILLARGRTTYAFTVIDNASLPTRLFAPRPVLVAALSTLVGVILSILAVAIRLLRSNARP